VVGDQIRGRIRNGGGRRSAVRHPAFALPRALIPIARARWLINGI
jgi:hypothetical protein